ncbi:sensor histidine kinase [Neobacillus cucumis]|uniref:sensor histidine kinase n=1 Tax=Neobacillus cucumis TaxID=1740721 RepID=UPI002E23067C|nr:histidine kinase [Neobacillus cucumis]MED4225582.1 histidine kinase [Neobacillus cucumis]
MKLKTLIPFKSLQFRITFLFFIVSIPIIGFLICNNYYSIQVVRNQIAYSNENMITLYMRQIDSKLQRVDDYLLDFAVRNVYLLDMDLPEKENNQKYNFSKIQLYQTISTDITNFSGIDTLFVYSETNKDLLTTYNYNPDYKEEQVIRNGILQIITNEKNYKPDQWYFSEINGHYYQFHIIKVGKVYVGAWGNIKNLMAPLDLIDLGGNGASLLVDQSIGLMGNRDFIKKNQINLGYKRNLYNLTGEHDKYLVVGAKSSKGDFSLEAIIPDKKILEKLPYLQRVIWLICIGSLVILPILYLSFRRLLWTPINKIVAVMRKIKDGHLETRINTSKPTSAEFELMNETFNSMMSELKELKINLYEEKLNMQKAELKHLQLQINPHFFMNALNVINNLAQVKNYHLVQEMTISLVQYFRFMFRSNSDFVLLGDEIEHTYNYLRIQELRFPKNLKYRISIPDSFKNCQVPPLLIQTFVENSIKHGMTMEQVNHINIKIQKFENKKIVIVIQDSGKGFPKEVLHQLQAELCISNGEGEHIGIWNVHRRLNLLYKKQAYVNFSNDPNGGAIVKIALPIL